MENSIERDRRISKEYNKLLKEMLERVKSGKADNKTFEMLRFLLTDIPGYQTPSLFCIPVVRTILDYELGVPTKDIERRVLIRPEEEKEWIDVNECYAYPMEKFEEENYIYTLAVGTTTYAPKIFGVGCLVPTKHDIRKYDIYDCSKWGRAFTGGKYLTHEPDKAKEIRFQHNNIRLFINDDLNVSSICRQNGESVEELDIPGFTKNSRTITKKVLKKLNSKKEW